MDSVEWLGRVGQKAFGYRWESGFTLWPVEVAVKPGSHKAPCVFGKNPSDGTVEGG